MRLYKFSHMSHSQSLIIKIIFIYFVQEREALLSWQMSFSSHFDQPMPNATHWPIGQIVPYQWMCGDWHGLAKKAAKTGSSWQVCYAKVRAAAACFVVVSWLSYDSQVVQYGTTHWQNPNPTLKASFILPNRKWGWNDTPSTPRTRQPRAERGVCSHVLSGG